MELRRAGGRGEGGVWGIEILGADIFLGVSGLDWAGLGADSGW